MTLSQFLRVKTKLFYIHQGYLITFTAEGGNHDVYPTITH